MNLIHTRCASQHLMSAALSALMLVATPPAMAGPGAHGPNGEHLDAPTTKPAASALPRLEAKSEVFELVAELRTGELVIMVDRFESNEPVLGAKLEVESGSLKAIAAYRAEQGDYAVTDAAMLRALAETGEHGLVFTLVAGQDNDLLDGTMLTTDGGPDEHAHGHDHDMERAAWIGAGFAALGLIGGIAWWRQRRSSPGQLQGGL